MERENRQKGGKTPHNISLTWEKSDFTWIKSRKKASLQMRGSRDCLEFVAWSCLSHLCTVTRGHHPRFALLQTQGSRADKLAPFKLLHSFPDPEQSGEGSSKELSIPSAGGEGVSYSPRCIYIIIPLILSVVKIIFKIYTNGAGEHYYVIKWNQVNAL